MILLNSKYGLKIPFQEGTVIILVLENTATMTEVVEELLQECNGDESENFLLLESDKTLKIGKEIEVIVNPFSMDFNNKKILNQVYSELSNIGNDYPILENELNHQAIQVLEKIISETPYNYITYNEEFDWLSLFKNYNVRIEPEYGSLLEKVVEYIKLLSALKSVHIVCFVNLHCYLNSEELAYLYKMAYYEKVNLFLIENQEYEEIVQEKVYIIDRDNCLIIKDKS